MGRVKWFTHPVFFIFFNTLWNEGRRPHVRHNTGPSQRPSKCLIHVQALLSQFLKIYTTDVVAGGKKHNGRGWFMLLKRRCTNLGNQPCLMTWGVFFPADFPVIQLLENLHTASLLIIQGNGEHPPVSAFSADSMSAVLIWSKCLPLLNSGACCTN